MGKGGVDNARNGDGPTDGPPDACAPQSPSRLFRGTTAMLFSVVAMGLGGLAFNAFAARYVSVEELGVQASLFFWITLINQLTSMGLPVLVARLDLAPTQREASGMLLWSFLVTIGSSIIGTIIFAVVAGPQLRSATYDALTIWGPAVGVGLMAAVVAGLSLVLLVEIRLVALGLGKFVVLRAVVVNVVRCIMVLVPALRGSPLALLMLNTGVNAASGVLCAVLLARDAWRRVGARLTTHLSNVIPEARFAGVNWIGTMAVQGPVVGFPVMANLTAAENGAFYLAWLIMAVVFVVPVTMSHVIVIEGSANAANRRTALVRGLLWSLALTGTIAAGAFALAEPSTNLLFGAGYDTTVEVLPILLAAGLPWSVTTMLLARARVDGDGPATALITAGFGIFAVMAGLWFTREDPVSSARAWFGANLAAAVAAGVSTIVLDRWRAARSMLLR
ncbi:lipopolysaccharide biosynthesis protein [Ilumatobacter sp.]|uniref:lipopolysaccharide biosynthesis protein n=1 Tax=Ilumatobacter sp. TaxID=1967498 RepID=UPI003C3C20C3